MHELQLRDLDLNLLVVLEALLAERSVTRAAARLGLTASATSHALARLRAGLGDELLVRTRGGMVPTPRGEQLLAPLRRVLAEISALWAAPAAFDPATSRREFVIATTDYVETVLLPPLLARVSSAAPGVQLRIRPLERSDVADALEGGTYHVVLAASVDPSPGLQQQVLFAEQMVLVCREGHPRVKRRVDLAAYLALGHVMVSVRGGTQSAVDERLAELGHTRRIALIVPHFLAAPLMVASSDLVLTAPSRLVQRLGEALALRTLAPPPELGNNGFTVRQVWHERFQHVPGHLWLRQQIFAAAAELRGR